MRYKPILRESGAFQRPVSAEQVEAMIGRAFGAAARPTEAIELGGGLWNTTLRVDGDGFPGPVIVRVAPDPRVQTINERDLMRTEYAVLPFLAPIGHLVPQVLFADFTRQVLPRDYLVQSVLPGVPASEGLAAWERAERAEFYRQFGGIARSVHSVIGADGFGRVGGVLTATWSGRIVSEFDDLVADLERAGLDAGDLRQIGVLCEAHADVLDQVSTAGLTLGDLWVPNVMVEAAAPTICGVFDTDRAVWGDPLSDWTIFQAASKPGTEVESFWDGYGRPDLDADGHWRSLVYAARHWGAIRLERHRLRRTDRIAGTYEVVSELLPRLAR